MPENRPENRNEVAFYLNQARRLAGQDRFEEALEAVTNAYRYATATEVALVDETGRQIEERRRQGVRELTAGLERLLALSAETLTDDQMTQGEELLARLRAIHTEPVEADRLQERWRGHRRQAHIGRILQETKRRLEELWGAHYLLLSRYDEARALARQQAGEYPEEVAFQELFRQAEQKREEAYKASGELTTQAGSASFKRLIEEVQRLYDRGEAELPWYQWGSVERDGKRVREPVFQKLVPASPEPITHLVAMARESEDGKAEEYRQRAQAALPADPELATEWVLPILLPDTPVPQWVIERLSPDNLKQQRELFTYCSEQKRKAITAFYIETIAPALKRRERARALLAKALEVGQDPESAWGLIAQAIIADPYFATKVEEARETLRLQLRVRWNQALQKAEDARREGRFEDALATAERILDQIGDDEGLADVAQRAGQMREDCQADRELLTSIQDEARRLTALAERQPAQAAQALAELEAKVEGRPLRFQQPLLALREAVRRRQSLEQKLAGWELRLRRTDPTGWTDEVFRDQAALQARLDDLDRILAETAGEGDDPRLTTLKARVAARQHALQGRAAWVAGLYDRARDHWLMAQGQDDNVLIRRWLQEAEDATQVSEALSRAESLQNDQRYKEALEILSPWRAKASPRQNEVITRYKTIGGRYAEELVEDIEDIIQGQTPLHRRLIDLINELESVDSNRAETYRLDRFPAIYEEWGDQAQQQRSLSDALSHYDEALKHARDEAHSRLARKRRQVRKQMAFNQAETLRRNRQEAEAQQVLEALLKEYQDDVETLCRLAEIALEGEDAARAQGYLTSASRRLDEATCQQNPGLAGLEQQDEVTEWRLRLHALEVRAEATKAIGSFMEEAKGRLQSSCDIKEYRLARESRDALIERLRSWESGLDQEAQRRSQELTRHRMAQSEWNRVRRWLQDQASNEVKNKYARLEGELLSALERDLANTTLPTVNTLEFRAGPPQPDIGKRWQIGLKVFYLSDCLRGIAVYQSEVLRALNRLRVTASRLQDDVHGPTEDLAGQPIGPEAALESQIVWAENVQAWAALVRDLLDDYAWAAGQQEGRNDAQQVHDKTEAWIASLLQLRGAAQTIKTRLRMAVEAGKDVRRHWGRVNWRQVVKQILPTGDWNDLENTDPDRRWEAWQTAAKFFQQQPLFARPERALWEQINQAIADAGIEEGWDRVLDPLAEGVERRDGILDQIEERRERVLEPQIEIRRLFGQHRLVQDFIRRKDEAEALRNRLVLVMTELYALVQAEEFQAALAAMERMEALDQNDGYGFQARMAMNIPQGGPPLGWQALRQRLEAQQRQWEEFQTWWAEVEHSALRRWQQEARSQVTTLLKRGEFHTARELGRDARDGVLPGGRTNRLGGGLALKPLLAYLGNLPDELRTPLSRRVERAMKDLAQWEHDAAEAVGELDITAIDDLQRKFEECEQELRQCIEAWHGLPDRFCWQRRQKQKQHKYCCQILERLRRLAPDSQEVRDREAELGGCAEARAKGRP